MTMRNTMAGAVLLVAASVQAKAADKLDLTGFVQTFADDFKVLDLSAHGPGTRWIAHTPWNGDFGDAGFGNPGPFGPFSTSDKGLRITASKMPDGRWVSGLICSMDRDGFGQHGFAQKYGYFEMRAKLPDGPGTWPAFWLVGVDKSVSSAEIDIVEYYGHDPRYFHSVQHIWVGGKDRYARDKMMEVKPHLLTDDYNNFGLLITPDKMTFYLNGDGYWTTPTPPEYKQPLYILANLALGGGWPIQNLQSPAQMDIAWIRVYQSKALSDQDKDHAGP